MRKLHPLAAGGVLLPVLLIIIGLLALPGDQKCITGRVTEPDAEPNDWMAMQRSFPYGKIKPSSYLAAVNQAATMMQDRSVKNTPWSFAGPDNIGGRITDIESPAGEPNTIYVGAATGGILKTTNFGLTWENLFDDVPVISVGDIAIDHTNPQVIYAGTGEANSSSFSFLGNGMYKSTDGGSSWQHIGLANTAYIGRVLVDHSNPQNIFVAAAGNLFTTSDERGVYRSTDGGNNWSRVLFLSDSTSAIDLVQHPTNPQILFASMWERSRGLVYRRSFGATSGLWKTADGGTTWSEVTGGLPTGDNVGRIGVTISKSDPMVMYTFYDLPDSEVAVYKSTDGGISWQRTNDGILQGMSSNFGWYFGQIRVHPTDPNLVFVMGVPIFRSLNGGNSWIDNWDPHVDHHAMFFDETNNRILLGNDGGLYYSTTQGANWEKINNLPLTQFYAIDIDYLASDRIYGGTQDNNTVRSLTGGISDWEPILGGDGMYTLVDYTNSDIVYAEYQWGNLHRSFDAGANMEYIAGPMSGDRVNWSAPLVMHPENPATLYFGTYRVWKSTNRGTDWVAVSPDLTEGIDNYFYTITTLAISSLNPSIVLAGSGDGRVHISVNNGQTWQNISAGLPKRWITRVAADPFNAQTIYATISGFRWDEPLPHVYKSTNLGQTWVSISGNLPEFPVNDIVLDPDLPGKIMVGTDAGVYSTEDGGVTWNWAFTGLPAVPVCAMKVHQPTRTVVAGTYGLSSYRANLDDIFTSVRSTGADQRIELSISPNPALHDARVRFNMAEAGEVKLALHTQEGRLIREFYTAKTGPGVHEINLGEGELSRLASGVYLITAKSKGYSGSVKFVKIR